MAHHLAELLQQARHTEGADRLAIEDRAASLILRIWASRHNTPGNVDPMRRLENVISVMDRMRPEAWPFGGIREDAVAKLLADAFDGLRTLVYIGVVTTQLEGNERIDAGVAAPFMDEKEQEICRRINEWLEFIQETPARPKVPRIVITNEQASLLDAEKKREAEIEALPESQRTLRDLTGQIDNLILTLGKLKKQLAAKPQRKDSGKP